MYANHQADAPRPRVGEGTFQVPPSETAALIFFATTMLNFPSLQRPDHVQVLLKVRVLLPRGPQLGGWAAKSSSPQKRRRCRPFAGNVKRIPSWFAATAHAPPAFDGQSAVVEASAAFRQSEIAGHLSGVILPEIYKGPHFFPLRSFFYKIFFCSLSLLCTALFIM